MASLFLLVKGLHSALAVDILFSLIVLGIDSAVHIGKFPFMFYFECMPLLQLSFFVSIDL